MSRINPDLRRLTEQVGKRLIISGARIGTVRNRLAGFLSSSLQLPSAQCPSTARDPVTQHPKISDGTSPTTSTRRFAHPSHPARKISFQSSHPSTDPLKNVRNPTPPVGSSATYSDVVVDSVPTSFLQFSGSRVRHPDILNCGSKIGFDTRGLGWSLPPKAKRRMVLTFLGMYV
ncbi:hypothetical protein FA13DRAFT_189506 [Coprinellus micaceus]|uniref:Uncharacterized protein n=1 Tax=Coprinellus micaceus TaxID=71717 RepID=A0A4Y7TI32_COPMI|nr:hypothetical protein FA13DRAFT_189506 [Coprinellus micaceus]